MASLTGSHALLVDVELLLGTDAAATERKAGVADDAAAARTNNDGELIRSEEQLNVNTNNAQRQQEYRKAISKLRRCSC